MNRLQDYALYDISWNLSPEHAVTMYLEWGNNDWHSEYPPVRSKEDVSHYFVVDSWGKEPVIRLVRRNAQSQHQRRGHGQGKHFPADGVVLRMSSGVMPSSFQGRTTRKKRISSDRRASV